MTSSLATRLAALPRDQIRSAIASLSEAEAAALLHDWGIWGRPEQQPPVGNWFCWFIRTGRGWGKTRTGSEWILKRVREGARHIALIGQTTADVRDTMIEIGDSAILKIASKDEMPDYEPSKRRLMFPNGAVATTFSGDKPDQLRGPQHDTVWIDEFAKFQYPEETWDNMEFGLRLGETYGITPQVLVTTTPRPIKLVKKIVAETTTIDVRGSTIENADNLSPAFIRRMRDKYEGTRIGRQELYGEILDDNPFALWHQAMIDAARVRVHPDLPRIVVGVDPAVTSTSASDDTGIVVAGIGTDREYYVLGDHSLHGSPHEWAVAVCRAFDNYESDRVIGEVNNGGDLVEVNIRTVDQEYRIPYEAVHASRGKQVRAEPIAAMYEQGKVHHVGMFADLEDQMTSWTPGDKSPDRMDALVWALWWLSKHNPTGNDPDQEDAVAPPVNYPLSGYGGIPDIFGNNRDIPGL